MKWLGWIKQGWKVKSRPLKTTTRLMNTVLKILVENILQYSLYLM